MARNLAKADLLAGGLRAALNDLIVFEGATAPISIDDLYARLQAIEQQLNTGTPTTQSYSDARAYVDAANGALKLPYSNGFDFKRDSLNTAYSMQTTQDHAIWKFECHTDDGNSATPGSGTHRSELVGDYSQSKTNNLVPFGTKVWQAFSQRVTGTLSANSADFVIANQWHAAQDTGDASLSPPLSFAFAGNSFRIATLWDDQAVQTNSTNTHFQGRYYDNSFPLNTWINWVVAATFDFNNPGNGTLEVWRDGTKVINLSGISMGYNDSRGPRLQFGLYRSAGYQGTLAIEYANMEVSYASLLDRVTIPRPIATLA
jgi:hypothetical protein